MQNVRKQGSQAIEWQEETDKLSALDKSENEEDEINKSMFECTVRRKDKYCDQLQCGYIMQDTIYQKHWL